MAGEGLLLSRLGERGGGSREEDESGVNGVGFEEAITEIGGGLGNVGRGGMTDGRPQTGFDEQDSAVAGIHDLLLDARGGRGILNRNVVIGQQFLTTKSQKCAFRVNMHFERSRR